MRNYIVKPGGTWNNSYVLIRQALRLQMFSMKSPAAVSSMELSGL
jgi:hypothetical protein